MNAVSLFSGIGGFDLGLARHGFTVTDHVEREPFCQRVLAARFPHATGWSDVREWKGDGHEPVALLCGGFPCQDLSVAGKRAGLAGSRSGLFWEIIRIAQAIQPTWGLFENVPGLFSVGRGADMATVLEGLRQCWPVVGYAVLDSQYFGVPQRRRRVFFACGPSVAGVEQILFNSQGSGGDFAPGDEARTDVASSLRSRSAKPGINPPGRGGEGDMNLVTAPLTLKPYGDQQGDESKLVVGTIKQRMRGCTDEVMDSLQVFATLNSGGNSGGFRTEPGEHLVAHSLRAEWFDASEDGTGRGTPLTLAFHPKASCTQSMNLTPLSPAIGTSKEVGCLLSSGVRRLTPTECERLQGFPDGWTCLCQPLESYDHMSCKCPDGPRYKALGNAVTVNVIEWIGQRMAQVAR